MSAHEIGRQCKLYIITPPQIELEIFKYELEKALDGENIGCVQLRLKDTSERDIIQAIETLAPITQDRNIAFILNDDPILAKKTGCDGVHIGQTDVSYEEARQIVGSEAIIGVTCHASRDLAMQLADKGADYVAFGAFFPTRTKETFSRPKDDILRIWTTMTTVPCVAIGGIRHENCGPLVRSGADFLAVLSAIWEHPAGPYAAVNQFNEKIIQNIETLK